MKELDWPRIREILKYRRHARYMRKQGYERYETDWQILRGSKVLSHVIGDAQVDIDGKHVWVKIVERGEK